MTIVNYATGEVVESTVTAEHASRWAERARLDLEAAADRGEAGLNKIRRAIAERHDAVMGYRSIGDYVGTEYADALGNVCRVFGVEFRREVVQELTSAGMSTRAIAPVVGVSNFTVHKDREAGVSDLTPDPESADVIDADLVDDEPEAHDDEPAPAPAPPPVVGRDGKTYKRPEPKAPSRATPRRALPDQFFDAAYDAAKKVESLHRLTGDDRFPQNAKKIAAKHRNDLLRTRDLLQQVINSLPDSEATK